MTGSTGIFNDALTRTLATRATIVAVDWMTRDLVRMTLEGVALRGAPWAPGQKIQIAMGSIFDTRTYTPINWDTLNGRTSIIGYAHGAGPGSDWLRSAKAGATCDFLGPRTSISKKIKAGPIALFGDETSIALAVALSRDARDLRCFFEVADVEAARLPIAELRLHDARLFTRTTGDTHLAAMEAAVAELVACDMSFLLTGKAATVQRLLLALKRHRFPSDRIVTKAYWASGKIGMD
ncbi:FAD-binding protein [Sphingobium sp. C100]|uniref:siderophore-interacting protein n=1 Tax=Sphingobium sp. C100 TaxID=1207055 RepID=UPI0003D5C369|nr:siderophore-interacting protein [Sphingobium sp. C100]ETI62856.1 FAD-binding protein [Sphingobium sp. C100]